MSDQDKKDSRQQDEPVAIIMSDGESYDFMVTVEGQKRIPRTGEWVHLYAYPLPAVAVQTGYCAEGDHCNCGGDLPRIREGCANWRNGNAAVTVPDGYVLVPEKPTPEMLDAAARASMQHLIDCIADPEKAKDVGSEEMTRLTHASRYIAMIAASQKGGSA